jgi:DNA-binding NarL/FixJ family response regulator
VSIRVLLADDQAVMRRGIRAVLQSANEIEIVGEASDGYDAVKKAQMLQPDVVLMDISMPGADGITATRTIKQRCPQARTLILTVHVDADLFRKAAEAGAVGYVLKDIAPEQLVGAIEEIHRGNGMVSPHVAKQMFNQMFAGRDDGSAGSVRRTYGLTQRQIEILIHLASGLSDKEIGAKVFLSEATVKTHLRTVYRRLKVRNRAQAAVFAVEHGLSGNSPYPAVSADIGRGDNDPSDLASRRPRH